MRIKLTLSSIIFIAAFSAVSLFASGQNYEGSEIREVIIKRGEQDFNIEILPALKTGPGKKVSMKDINFDMKTLYATGRFSDISVAIDPAEDTLVNVIFRVRPLYFIKEVNFSGEYPFSDEKLEERANVMYLTPFRDEYAHNVVDNLLEFFKTAGYRKVEITWGFTPDDSDFTGNLEIYIQSGPPTRIEKVKYTDSDNKKIEINRAVLEDFGISPVKGKVFDALEIDSWLKDFNERLYEKGYYTSSVSLLGKTFNDNENTVNLDIGVESDGRIIIETGLTDFTEKDVRSLQGFKTGKPLGREVQREWVNLIRDYFSERGYTEIKVYSSLEKIESRDPLFNKKINKLRFLIKKGPRKYLKRITLTGLDFDEDKTTRVLGLTSSPDDLEIPYSNSLESTYTDRILNYLRSEGFINASISSVQTENMTNSSELNMIINVEPGNKYRISQIIVKGEPVFTEDEIFEILGINVGEAFIPARVDAATTRLSRAYERAGYEGVEVISRIFARDADSAGILINITIPEKIVVEEIILSGNFKTNPERIFKRISFSPGDSITRSDLLKAQLRMYDMGLFSKVEFSTLAGDITSQTRRVVLKLQESQPILITYGIGADTENLLRGSFSISHNNLNGTGQKANFGVILGYKESSAQFTYHVPEFASESWDLYASVYYEQHLRESFGITRGGGIIQLSKKISPAVNYLFSLSVEKVELFDVQISELLIPPEERDASINSLSAALYIDYRNDPFNPEEGFLLNSNFKWASSLLGSRTDFIKSYFTGNLYQRVFDDVVLALGLRVGMGMLLDSDEPLPPSERFFAGGSNSLRAYSLDSVGPVDDESGLPLGGNAMIVTNAELRMPVFGNFGVVIFFDAGNVFEKAYDFTMNNLSTSVGIGLRYNTPVGPLRVDFGFSPDDYDNNQIFLSIGHAF